ncbi:hypothetical protein [Streptomyces sp. NPDC047043]|uniref:hypothetical protein n=1 Tax=Streptomyces sp. NPDC047043 TaxID=3154497 RepID=UPI0033D106ED
MISYDNCALPLEAVFDEAVLLGRLGGRKVDQRRAVASLDSVTDRPLFGSAGRVGRMIAGRPHLVEVDHLAAGVGRHVDFEAAEEFILVAGVLH